jgi:hypothetical protein
LFDVIGCFFYFHQNGQRFSNGTISEDSLILPHSLIFDGAIAAKSLRFPISDHRMYRNRIASCAAPSIQRITVEIWDVLESDQSGIVSHVLEAHQMVDATITNFSHVIESYCVD